RLFLEKYPDVPSVRSDLGAALAGAGRYEEAIAEYKRALQLKPLAQVRLNLALAYDKSAKLSLAVAELKKVREEMPGDLRPLMLEADCYLRLGENKKVIELLTPVHQTNGDGLAIAYMLGTALVRDNQAERGQVLIDRILRNGDSAEARLLLGTTKMMAGDYAGARNDLQRAVQLNPKLPDVYSNYGAALMLTGDTAAAVDAFRKELEANPNDFTSNLDLGALLRQDQKNKEALDHFERALRSRPGDPGARFQIASVHFAQGNIDQARAELEQLVKASPQFSEAHVTLATIYYRLKRKADGERERAIVQKLKAERQATGPGSQASVAAGPAKNEP